MGQFVAKSTGVVVINGQRFNVSSGKALGVIDGFVAPKSAKPQHKKAAPPKATTQTKKLAASQTRVVRPSGKVHHRTEHSKTLLRNVVRRPAVRTHESASPVSKITKPAHRGIDGQRLNRAKRVTKSELISHFSGPKARSGGTEPIRANAIKKVAHARPMQNTAQASGAAALSAASHQQLERILDHALLTADAHKQTLHKRRNRFLNAFGLPRWLTLLIITVLVILASLAVMWRSVPAVAIKVASIRSHYAATLPSYTPTGYRFHQVQSAPGSVTIQYEAKSGAASQFSLTQSASTMDSQSLRTATLPKNEAVQTSQVGGTTVYIYGAHDNAEWVSNGSLYQLSNDGHLSSDQILQIAASL